MSQAKENKFVQFLEKGYEKEGVGASTRKTYISIMKNVRKGMNYKGTSLHFAKDIKGVEELIKSKSKSYKISAFSAIVKLMKDKTLKKQYREKINDINKVKIEESKEGRYTDKERKTIGGLSWADLEKIIPMIREELKNIDQKEKPKQYYITYQYLILSLVYLKCKFLPRLDYCSIKVIYDKSHIDETQNQLLVEDDKMTIMFNKFKNKKSVGSKSFEICDEVREEISDWLFFKNNDDKDNLFYNLNKSKPYDNKRFSELIKRMFLRFLNTPVSANHIRKLKEKHIQTSPEYPNLSLKEREALHEANFHSKATAELHYQKT